MSSRLHMVYRAMVEHAVEPGVDGKAFAQGYILELEGRPLPGPHFFMKKFQRVGYGPCPCFEPTHYAPATYDDWGEGPMCVMCGRMQDNGQEVCDDSD